MTQKYHSPSVLRGLDNRPADRYNPISDQIEIFLLDFEPYDQSKIDKFLREQGLYESPSEDSSNDNEQEDWNIKKKKQRLDSFVCRFFGLGRFKGENRHFSVSLDVVGFRPYFFIKVSDQLLEEGLNDTLLKNIREQVKCSCLIKKRYDFSQGLLSAEVVRKKPFYGYTANDKFSYAKLTFNCSRAFNNYRRYLEEEGFQLFESDIEPMLRMLHIQEITPSGWILIDREVAIIPEGANTSMCNLHLKIDLKQIKPLNEINQIPPIVTASFDLEAGSSHGDFPVAIKGNQKLAQDLMTEFLKVCGSSGIKLAQGWKIKKPHHLMGMLYNWCYLAFQRYYDNNNFNYLVVLEEVDFQSAEFAQMLEEVVEIGAEYYDWVVGGKIEHHRGGDGYYIGKMMICLEKYLPEQDLTQLETGNYQLLAEQLLKEIHRMTWTYNRYYLEDPVACVRFWFEHLIFNRYYDNPNVNRVYTYGDKQVLEEKLQQLVPQVFAICQECFTVLNKPKEKKKSQPKVGPKKFLMMEKSKEQRTLSQSHPDFIVNRSDRGKSSDGQGPKRSSAVNGGGAKSAGNKSSADGGKPGGFRDKYLMETDQVIRGRYIKKLKEDEKIGRDFYVKWLTELFDRYLPRVEGDPIIQIGTTFKRYGEKELFLKHIITLDGCDSFTNQDLIRDENRDIFISDAKDALAEAKKYQLNDPVVGVVKRKYQEACDQHIKNPDIPELEELNQLISVCRRNQQLENDQAVVRIESYQTEREVLLAWRKLILETDPDVITGYNIFGFDFKYLWDRAQVLGIQDQFRDLGRIREYQEELVEKKLVSSGLGDNLLYYIKMTGRVLVDLLKVVQSGNFKLPVYKLDFVCNTFLYKRKNDLPPQEIFRRQKGSDLDRSVIARYCLVDCLLCNRLMDRLEIITNNIGMSKVCKVPLSYLFLRGQGVKILSLVSDITRQEGYLIKTKERLKDGEDDEGYEGAIVLDPVKGIYFEPSVVADFNSLYPSCMIAWNLSHDSYVEIGGKYDHLPEGEYYDVQYDLYRDEQIPGRKATRKVKYGVKTCRFYQPSDGSKSILPRILQRLLKARKDTRKDQKKFPKGSFEWNVKEGLQLAYKVTANSLYGQVGARTSAVHFKEIAACTTACGRGLIYQSRDYFEEKYPGCRTIYGDSVTGDTPILVRDAQGLIDIVTIETLTDEWGTYQQFKPYDSNRREKQQGVVELETWTRSGWAKIRRVIRHKCQKKIYQVNTYNGCVEVTEDHSLLDEKGEKIKPGDCQVGETKLLHGYPDLVGREDWVMPMVPEYGVKGDDYGDETFECSKCGELRTGEMYYYQTNKKTGKKYRANKCKICIKQRQCEGNDKRTFKPEIKHLLKLHVTSYPLTPEEAWVWGFFFADGSCGKYGEKSNTKWSWALNNQDLDRLKKAELILNSVEPDGVEFRILDTFDSSAIYKLVPVGSLKYMVEKYRSLFYDKDKFKKVPKIILNAPYDVRWAFFEGYYEGDGCKKGQYGIGKNRLSFACKGKIGAQGLYYVARSLGYHNIVISLQDGKDNIYFIRTNFTRSLDERKMIRKINDFGVSPEQRFVYDLETEDGSFLAGVGSMVILNTDSIFSKFQCQNIRGEKLHGLDAIYKSIELCTEGSLGISRLLPKPHNLEFEKAIWPFMLVSKKRYHGHYYTEYGSPGFKPKSMGIVLKRRDNAKIVKHVFGGVLDIIFFQHDIEKAYQFCQEESSKLLKGHFPIEMFTITKTLKSYYKNPDQIAHNVLAQRIAERDPGNKPQSNDRMEFAYIQISGVGKKDKVLQGDRIETPQFIKDNGLKIDYRHYFTNQVMKPVTQIFELVCTPKQLAKLFSQPLIEYDRERSGTKNITQFIVIKKKKTKQEEDEELPSVAELDKILGELRDEEDKDNHGKGGHFVAEKGDEVLYYGD